MNQPTVQLIRRETFSASHRLHSEKLSDEENRKTFGKCNHINGHGHNYVLEVTVAAPVCAKTGMVMNLVEMKHIILEHVIDKVDHKHMNLDVPEFKTLVPTAENMAVIFWTWLKTSSLGPILQEIRLHETENNVVVYRG